MPDVSDISPLGPRLTLFTAGKDSTYALGLTQALVAQGCELDFIGCDELTPLGLPDYALRRCSFMIGEATPEKR